MSGLCDLAELDCTDAEKIALAFDLCSLLRIVPLSLAAAEPSPPCGDAVASSLSMEQMA
ncbi:hypothetical protein SAMN04487785_102421 [Dyella jiangningensis]|uniref:hypothetical protein n=1 Tax=Dyella sp. AtDHG13 TaxID=1938897 RepID=UPI00088AEBFB|nr:hypothetical protein [Dyella sp. AtDHG13]PXV60693.1 hypothetical protein BDW41_102420 [Dyella sp. AtDHG13]SDJ55388.1 hypothetical protein SAMN04487785_102421 [Dyella jiangningensis]